MAFLDNSGDIILDAVLTDTGRYRLAKGDGSFRIAKYALADDEINYANYNFNHPSGSAYYDLDILQTPVLEAFTNNIATCKHKLLSIPRTNLLYLPAVKICSHVNEASMNSTLSTYLVAVDKDTEEATDVKTSSANHLGMLAGAVDNGFGTYIRLDQGLDTSDISHLFTLDADLMETQYIIEIDNRLGQICKPKQLGATAALSFIDDDQVASYYVSLSANAGQGNFVNTTDDASSNTTHTISGPRGTKLEFGIKASLELNSSTYLFTKLGGASTITTAAWGGSDASTYNYIDSQVRVTGGTTGYSVNIPIRFIKKV